jgi:hypothetical protein
MKSLTQLNVYSTSSVSYTDQGAGAGQVLANRYQINGLVDTSKSVLENIEKIASAAGSWLSYDVNEGKWGIVINSTGTSVASFDDSNVIGNVSVSGTGLDELYNSVKVQFPHRDLRDSGDFITIEIPSGDRNPNEPDNSLNISYDNINEPVQANLLGLIELKQSRVNLIVSFQTDFSYINLKAGDLISLTNSRLQFTNKVFRIMTVKEVQGDGALMVDISALEYDADVYSTADLYRFTRTDENGIITIGSIGTPGTPQVTKFEVDARPRVLIESLSPTGVVEGMEFWLSYDVGIADDNRSYQLIATERPTGGGTYDGGTNVTFEYDSVDTGNFVVKTRGFNATTTGPYSDPSGFVFFTATQVTNAIGPETQSIGTALGVLTALGAINSVFDLYKNSTGETSIFKKVFELLKETTGIDLLAGADGAPILTSINPSSGLLAGGESVTIFGNRLGNVTDVKFGPTTATSFTVVNSSTITAIVPPRPVGSVNVFATNSSGTNAASVVYTYSAVPLPVPTITDINPSTGPTSGGTLVNLVGTNFTSATNVTFNGVAGTGISVISDTSIEITTPAGTAGAAVVVVTTPVGTGSTSNQFTYQGASGGNLTIVARYPPDRTTFRDPFTNLTSDAAPITGSYYLVFNTTLYAPLTAGSAGTVKLYKSDGTLVETLIPSQLTFDNNVVGFPFATRELGTDYYILMDEGLIIYCNSVNPAITQPTGWNFNTPPYATDVYSVASNPPFPLPSTTPTLSSFTPSGTQACRNDIVLSYNTNITKGAGNAYLKLQADASTVATIAVSSATLVSNSSISIPVKANLELGTAYYLETDAGFVKSIVITDCFSTSTNAAAVTTASNVKFTVETAVSVSQVILDSKPYNDPNKINKQTNVGLKFNRAVTFTNTGTITIYADGGAVKQAIPVNTNFNQNRTSELLWIGTSTTATLDTLWINPTSDFTTGVTYYVQATPTCVQDACGETWAGINDTTSVRFSIYPGPTSAISPVNTSSLSLEFNYDTDIAPSSGKIKIYDDDNNLLATVDSNDPSIDYS